MAPIKALEGRTVHQIQSGQVIVDLCSVVKELVENGLDAEATSIEVRFKNNGLEAIEVQDNGVGISSENYETIALKHYTSKLSSFDDLTSLTTFGFRGEALSSLCALSSFHILTARVDEAPKGTRLDFEVSGKLKGIQVVASQKGTTVVVENLFMNLPVRRRELEKNIKREYGKVIGILQAYACISTKTKFTVSNVMAKGRKAVVFSTKSNPTTRENIANVYGAKVLYGLVALDLNFETKPSKRTKTDTENKQVLVSGHVSRPIFGEGRQAPDRQMFFVNARPCALPQVSKVFNEVYKSYNLSQSPFIFANIVLDTNAYDVNVSPDKRTILLHDQNIFLESLKRSLIDLFERQEQTVPQSQQPGLKLSSFKPLSFRPDTAYQENSDIRNSDDASRPPRLAEGGADNHELSSKEPTDIVRHGKATSLIENYLDSQTRKRPREPKNILNGDKNGLEDSHKLVSRPSTATNTSAWGDNENQDVARILGNNGDSVRVDDFNRRLAEQQPRNERIPTELPCPETESDNVESIQGEDRHWAPANAGSGIVQNAFDRMRPKLLGSLRPHREKFRAAPSGAPKSRLSRRKSSMQKFGSSMSAFAAPGTQVAVPVGGNSDIGGDEEQGIESGDEQMEDDSSSAASGSQANTDSGMQEELQERGEVADEELEAGEDEGIRSPASEHSEDDSDDEFLDDKDKRAKEDTRVAKLIQQAEDQLAMPTSGSIQRAHKILSGSGQKDSTTQFIQVTQGSVDLIEKQMQSLQTALRKQPQPTNQPLLAPTSGETSPEERLSLTVSKEDFSRMHIVGQFNLGFILATRPGSPPATSDELFIIDQHASDEKYNFERLQSSTVVQNQRLVHPRTLDLTAIEEEIILENNPTLLKNGFLVSIDQSGELPVGQRCKLLSLPMSREVTFDIEDLEELIALLADAPLPPVGSSDSIMEEESPYLTKKPPSSPIIPRPSKVRRMFAMRACRSSVMIGKPLSTTQMERLVRRMGEIDKPWNCPHGRPTMRHLLGLGEWQGWDEDIDEDRDGEAGTVDWRDFLSSDRGHDGDGMGEAEIAEESEAACDEKDEGEYMSDDDPEG